MKIESLSNGMIVFDNGEQILEVKKELVKGINMFPPEKDHPLFGNKYNAWRVIVNGEGFISFESDTREGAEHILELINDALR